MRMRIWASLTYAQHHTSMSTRVGPSYDAGALKCTRWEWGFGKGQWKRRIKKNAEVYGMKGKICTIYFVIGCYYRVSYTGTKRSTNLLYGDL